MPNMDLMSFLAVWFNNLRKNVFKVEVTNQKEVNTSRLETSLNRISDELRKIPSAISSHPTVTPKSDSRVLEGYFGELKRAILNLKPKPIQQVEVTNQKETKFSFPSKMDTSGSKVEVTNLPKVQRVEGDVGVRDLKKIVEGLQVVVDAIADMKMDLGEGIKSIQLPYMANSGGGQGSVKISDGTNLAHLTEVDGHFALDVNVVDSVSGGGGGGTEYTEGDIDATIVGTAILWEDGSNTLRAVSAAKPLPVDIQDSTIAVTQSGSWSVIAAGDVASGSADSGNPVKVGGKFNNTLPTFTDGQRGDLQIGTRGLLRTALFNDGTGNVLQIGTDNADDAAVSATSNKMIVMSRGQVFDGTAWDRMRGDATDGLLVNLGSNNDVTVTGAVLSSIETSVQLIDDSIYVDNASWTDDTSKHILIGGLYKSAQQSITDGRVAPIALSSNGNVRVDVNSMPTTNVNISQVAGSGATSWSGSSSEGDGGIIALAVRNDTATTSLTNANLDYAVHAVDVKGRQFVTGDASMVALKVDGSGVTQPISGTLTAVTSLTGGGVADDGTTPGNPVMVGGFAISPDGTDPGSVSAEADVARFRTDLNRRLLINNRHPRSLHKHLDGSTAYTDESIAADPGDGFQIVITSIIVSTGSATAMNFFLEEGSTKIFGPVYLEAVAGRGFVSGPIYLPVTASTAVTITTSASIAQAVEIDYFIQAV